MEFEVIICSHFALHKMSSRFPLTANRTCITFAPQIDAKFAQSSSAKNRLQAVVLPWKYFRVQLQNAAPDQENVTVCRKKPATRTLSTVREFRSLPSATSAAAGGMFRWWIRGVGRWFRRHHHPASWLSVCPSPDRSKPSRPWAVLCRRHRRRFWPESGWACPRRAASSRPCRHRPRGDPSRTGWCLRRVWSLFVGSTSDPSAPCSGGKWRDLLEGKANRTQISILIDDFWCHFCHF